MDISQMSKQVFLDTYFMKEELQSFCKEQGLQRIGNKLEQRKGAFFIQQIGESFHFYVSFQKWLKANAGKTYRDAVAIYPQLLKEQKEKKTAIDEQFEYNTYIRAFFCG